MRADLLLHSRPMKQPSGRDSFLRQRVQQQGPENQPLMDGDIETNFRPPQYSTGQLVLHQAAKYVLGTRSPQLEVLRQAGGEVDDSRIEEGRPDLQRMSHADAIHLVEDVVGQVVALIEFQVAL